MSAKKRKPISDEEVFEQIHHASLGDNDVVQLGVSTPQQGALFERIRTGMMPGEILSRTFDRAVKDQCPFLERLTSFPGEPDEKAFDEDVLKLENLTEEEIDLLDLQVSDARLETREEDGSINVSRARASGFGSDVYGFAYDVVSKKWMLTNRFGEHGQCAFSLSLELEGRKEKAIISGLIFRIPFLRTLVMTPGGWIWMDDVHLKSAIEDLMSWKRFIMLSSYDGNSEKVRWNGVFTLEKAKKAKEELT